MSVYQKYLTVGNSAYRNVIEPSGGDTGNDYMRVGNNGGGTAYWILLKLPTDLPKPAQVSDAILRLTEYDSSYRGDNALTMYIARITGAWSASTNFNGLPSYDTSNVVDYTLDSSNNPDSSNYDGRTRYYRYSKYQWYEHLLEWKDTGENVTLSYYNGADYYSGGYRYFYDDYSYYDDYWVWQDINITSVIQDCIDNSNTGLLLYFTLQGTNDTRKYFRTPLNTSTDWQPRLTITYTADEPTTPKVPTFTMGTKGYIDLSSRTSSGLTHTLSYAFGSKTGTIATKTTSTSYGWTPAISTFAPQVTNAASGSGTLYCDTYSGDTLIGTKSVTLTMQVPTTVAPTINSLTATNKSSNATVNGWSEFVKGYSCAELKATANTDAAYGSTISSYKFEVLKSTTVKYSTTVSTNVKDTSLFNEAGTDYSFRVTVTDSRGMTAIKTIEGYTVYDYYIPTISAVDVFRCDVNGVEDMETGTYASAKGTFTISSVNGKNTITVNKIEYKTYAASVYNLGMNSPASGTAHVIGDGNISTLYAYDIRFCLKDAISGEVYSTIRIKPAFVTLHVKGGGKGIGIGGAATADEMQVYMPAVFKDSLQVTTSDRDYSALIQVSSVENNALFGCAHENDFSLNSYVRVSQSRFEYNNGANNYAIYHAGNLNPAGYLPLSGGTMTGEINMNNKDIENANRVSINDPGQTEGIEFKSAGLNSTYFSRAGTDEVLRIYNAGTGYLDLGCGNTAYAHFVTDRGQFYFNKQMHIAGELTKYGTSHEWMRAGRHVYLGTCTLDDNSWKWISLSMTFPGIPRISLIANTASTGSITAKVKGVATNGFYAVIGGTGATSMFDIIAVWN